MYSPLTSMPKASIWISSRVNFNNPYISKFTIWRQFASKQKEDKKQKAEAQKEALRQKFQDIDLEEQLEEWISYFEETLNDLQNDFK